MATNTTNTFTPHTGNGTEVNFAISFSYILTSDIDVTVAGVLKTLGTHYTISGSTVTFTSGNVPANGAAIKFQRDTSISTKAVDFQDGSVLTEQDLDNNTNQILFAQQEIIDKLGGIEEGATADQTVTEIKSLIAGSPLGTTHIADDAVTNAKIAPLSVGTNEIGGGQVTEAKLASGSVTTAKIADNSVNSDKIAENAVTSVELAANSVDSSELVDGSIDHSHLSNDCVDGDNIQDDSINSEHYIDGSIDEAHIANNAVTETKIVNDAIATAKIASNAVTEPKIADNAVSSNKIVTNAVTTAKIADAELKTLAGMQSGTASKLADSTALTADIADLNQIDGLTKQTTISDSDASFPTSGAVVDYVAAQIAPIGGLEVIATDAAFPNTQPQSGVVISIADAGGLVVDANGTSTTARTVGGSTVTINNFASNFNSSTVDAGVAIMVSSTGSGQIYNYHKATLKEADLLNLSNDINDFANRYRVTDGEPSSNNDEGDLIYDKQADKMKVYDSTTTSFKEVTSVGDFKFLFLCPTGGSGSPTINGSIATYDLREGSTSGSAASVTNAAQLLVSVNGVVQKPNTGTSAPSEGFAMVDSNTIIFGSNLPTGAEVFVIQIGSAVSLQVPADDTVSTAKIQNQGVTTGKIADDAIITAKIASNAVTEPKIADNSISSNKIVTNAITTAKIADEAVTLAKLEHGTSSNDGKFLRANNGADPTFETVSSVGGATGVDFNDNVKARFGDGNDLEIFHDGTGCNIRSASSKLEIRSDSLQLQNSSAEKYFRGISDGAAELYHDGSKKFETTNNGAKLATGDDPVTLLLQNTDLNTATDSGGEIIFKGTKNSGNPLFFGAIAGKRRNQASDEQAYLAIYRQNGDGGHTGVEVMRFDHLGRVGVNKQATGVTFDVEPITDTHAIRANGQQAGYSTIICDNRASSGTRHFLDFRINNSQTGTITSTGSSTSYNTSSDYRLKENVVAISDGITRLKTLKPSRFNWKADSSTTVDGFLAHEVTAVPEAITGTKDAVVTQALIDSGDVSADSKLNDPIYQAIDQSKLVPLLTAALQEAIAKIEVLETKVAALEAK